MQTAFQLLVCGEVSKRIAWDDYQGEPAIKLETAHVIVHERDLDSFSAGLPTCGPKHRVGCVETHYFMPIERERNRESTRSASKFEDRATTRSR
jgi:hypothetical protein